MNRFFLIILLVNCIPKASYSQNIDSVSKITIEYGHGGNSWEPGIYGISETFEFTRINPKLFKNTKSIFVKRILEKDGHTYVRDTSKLPFRKQNVSTKTIKNILLELNNPADNFTQSFIQPLLKKPSNRQILLIAKKYNYSNFLFSKDGYKEDRNITLNRIKRFYLIDSFLSLARPDFKNELVVLDSYHGCRLYIIHSSDTTRYDFMFSNSFNILFGQPISRIDFNDFMHIKHITNLEANKAIEVLLPSKSLLRMELDFSTITEQYIIWFLKNGF